MSEFGELSFPVARKRHRCELCYGPIPKGEKHTKWDGVFDGYWQHNRLHTECHQSLCDENNYEYTPGEGEMPERVKAIWEAEQCSKRATALVIASTEKPSASPEETTL